ncbi:hypothetical protein [Pontibacter sp. G13]|uniref:hypothetical protein n=1 Tax=Pontibacter sp. G13 TaxID=3074898 RepID=UPI00288BB6F5|nr:hypothetical protein [Pontibacter sp. G13]WNJ18405.1 hypothetical protein RJD25_26420 [Pontibacter sp. G13]
MKFAFDTAEQIAETVDLIDEAEAKEEFEPILQKCIQRAQVLKNHDLEFEARYSYLNLVTHLNKKDLAIGSFPWLLNYIDQYPSWYDRFRVLWCYKWVIISLPQFTSISKAKIEQLRLDMEKRYQEADAGTKVIHYFKCLLAIYQGELKVAAEHYEAYKLDEEAGSLDDCEACQPNALMELFMFQKDYQQALDSVQVVLSKRKTCKDVPATTFPAAAFAHLMLNQEEEAAHMFANAQREMDFDTPWLDDIGYLLMYCAMTGQWVQGRKILEKQLPFTAARQPEYKLYWFYLGVHMFFRAMSASGLSDISLKVEKAETGFPLKGETCDLGESISWLNQRLTDLSNAIDQRNGNSFYRELRDYHEAMIAS